MTGDIFDQTDVTISLANLDFPLVVLIDEIEAEIKMRHRVYANRVANNRMTQSNASRKIAKMTEVLRLLKRMKGAIR